MTIIVHCPHCQRQLDTHQHIGTPSDETPEPGDALLCWRCRGAAIVDTNTVGRLTARTPTTEETADINTHPATIAARAATVLHPNSVSAAVAHARHIVSTQ